MGRKPREYSCGFVFHVTQRGVNREYIFRSREAKQKLLATIRALKKDYDFDILGYVIMDNHYHLIIKMYDDKLEDVMFMINNRMSHFLKFHLNRTGHVFESRYFCKKVESNGYLLWLLRYVHRNPIRAKIVNNIDDYIWSSHGYYKYGIRILVNVDFILNIFSSDKQEAINQYMKLIRSIGDDSNEEEDFKLTSSLCQNRLEKGRVDFKTSRLILDEFELHELESKIFGDGTINDENLNSKKKNELNQMKANFILAAVQKGYELIDISVYLGISMTSVRRLLKPKSSMLHSNL